MTPSAYWHMLEAEGRLKRQAFHCDDETNPLGYLGGINPWSEYLSLRLTEEERERLKYQQPQIHTNLEALGD